MLGTGTGLAPWLSLARDPEVYDRFDDVIVTLQAQFEFLAHNPQIVALLGQGTRSNAAFAPAIKRLVVLLAEGQGLGQVRDDLDPHLAAAQALILMVGYLSMEGVIAASARTLDEPALRERWREAAVDLVVNGVRAA